MLLLANADRQMTFLTQELEAEEEGEHRESMWPTITKLRAQQDKQGKKVVLKGSEKVYLPQALGKGRRFWHQAEFTMPRKSVQMSADVLH